MTAHEHTQLCVVRGSDGGIRVVCGRVARLLVGAKSTPYRVRQARDAMPEKDPDRELMTFALQLVIASVARAASIKPGEYVTSTLRGDRGRDFKVLHVEENSGHRVAVLEVSADFPGMPVKTIRRYVSDLKRA